MTGKRLKLGPHLAKKGNYPGAVAVELREISGVILELAEILENIPRFEEWKKAEKK